MTKKVHCAATRGVAWFAAASMTVALFQAPSALAEWDYHGTNRLTLEHYGVDGDESNGLYPYEGFQGYDDLNLSFSRIDSPYRSLQGYLLATANHSDYRGDKRGKLSNASVVYETGESAIPYRLQFGDYFASQSRYTLQRGLKGMQFELQPQNLAGAHSLQLFLGRSAEDYKRLFDDREDYYLGASWLTESETLGALALTSVSYRWPESSGDARENVSSIAWQHLYQTGGFSHSIETEAAYLSGENGLAESLSETSLNLLLNGYSESGQSYRLNLERTDERFAPSGAAVTPDREGLELQWGQPLSESTLARLRLQRYRDSLSSSNISTARIVGVNLSGLPFSASSGPMARFNLNADLNRQSDEDEQGSLQRTTTALQLNGSLPISPATRARLGYQGFKTDDRVADTLSIRQSLACGFDHSYVLGGWSGSLSPTLRYVLDRDVQNSRTDNLSLGLTLSAARGNDRLFFSHLATDFSADDPAATESTTGQTRFTWQREMQRHSLALGLDHFKRDPDGGESTDSYKVSLSWVWRFDKRDFERAGASVQAPALAISQFKTLDDLSLGSSFDSQTQAVLTQGGFHYAGRSGIYRVYDGKLFAGIENRQLLAVESDAGSVASASLIVPVSTDPAKVQLVYRQLLDEMLKQYGAPRMTIERGGFSGDWLAQLRQGSFARIVEWQVDAGLLRLGIPQPKTEQVRIEIQLRERFPAADTNDWGLPQLF